MPPVNKVKKLDVRPLIKQGGEPYPAIRKALDALSPGQKLMLLVPFMPSPLIEKLEGEGYSTKLERSSGSDWVVYFWKESQET